MGHAHDSHAAHGHEDLDFTHDVDAKKLTLWLVGSTVGVFGIMWVLFALYEQIIQHQKHLAVELATPEQRAVLEAKEERELSGAAGGKSVDDAIRNYVQTNEKR
ncbi:MAG: hypothetical protein AB7I19_04280 [Planctomycetota bacterium]